MKDSRYIELLNLYVDHQLTPAESAELEAEVNRTPERRRVYLQYCRMHKACTLLFEADRSLAPKTAAAVVAIRRAQDDNETAATGGWSWSGWRWAGLTAAAACTVLVATRVISPTQADLTGPMAVAVADSSAVPVEAFPAVGRSPLETQTPWEGPGLAPRRLELQSVLFTNAFRSGTEESTPLNAELAWLNEVKLPSLRSPRVEDLEFADRPTSLSQSEGPVFVGRRPFQGNVEMTAFQFQR